MTAWDHEYTCDESTAPRLARSIFRTNRKALALVFLLLGAVGLYVAIAFYESVVVAVIVVLVLVFAGVLAARRQGADATRATAGPGMVYRSRFLDDAFELEGPMGSNRVPYDTLASVETTRDDVVLFSQRDVNVVFAVPAEVFPAEQVARVQALVVDRHG